MVKKFFNTVFEQKFYLMFITAIVYILGLVGFFQECSLQILGILILVFGILIFKKYISLKLVFIWVFIFFLAFFNAYFRIHNSDDLSLIAPKTATIQGQIATIPDISLEKRERFFVNVNKITYENVTKNISAKTFVTIEEKPNIKIGEYYEFSGKLRTPFKVSNPSQFDYAKYLRNYDTFTTFFADDIKKLDIPLSYKWKFLQNLNNIRTDILSIHSEYIKSPNIEILGGVVFGDDAVSPPDYIKKSFVNSGILHILAASGMNVALIYGIFFYILSKIRVPYKLNNILGIFVVILYTLMTGMGPSVIRASIILIFILIGKLIDRDAHSISLLSFVAILMLLFNPAYINDVGFQLSFVVTFGLLIMTKPVFELVKFMPNWLSSTIFIPIIAQIWVAPIQMFYFNTFCLYSILANILILPFITVISFGGFISSVIALIKPISNFTCMIFDFVLNPVISGLIMISDYFSKLPNSLITMPQPSFLQMVLYYIMILLIVRILQIGLNKKYIIAFLITISLFLSTFIKIWKGSEIIFFDVQNADCFLYRTKQGKYFIIDTGKMGFNGHKNQINYILMEYLKDLGIKEIEGLILTHFDSDHAGGAEDLINNYNVKTIYVNSTNDFSRLANKLYKLNSYMLKAKNNETIYVEDGIKIKTYIADFQGKGMENENSVITLIDDNGYRILLMGDAGVKAYYKLKEDLPRGIDVLKVGHHGAKNVVNKDMLEYLSPKYSIISTGINKFGHPNDITLEILKPTKILRTDKNNAIKIRNKKVYVYDRNKGFKRYR